MDKVSKFGAMAATILVTSKMARRKVKAFTSGQMEVNTQETGRGTR